MGNGESWVVGCDMDWLPVQRNIVNILRRLMPRKPEHRPDEPYWLGTDYLHKAQPNANVL